MKNYITILFLAGLLFTPCLGGAEGDKLWKTVPVLDADPGNFEKDVTDAGEKMNETWRTIHRNKFFGNVYSTIRAGDIKKAEQLLDEQIREIPEYKKDASYRASKSKIAYAKGDYKAAYAEADKIITDIEKAFAPKKLSEITFSDEEKEGIHDSYILRYQAVIQMKRYKEALADLDQALLMKTTADGLRAKTGTLIALNRISEAADVCEKAYTTDKTILSVSPNKNYYCWVFSEHGNKVKACTDTAVASGDKSAKDKTVK
ncbi:MAG: hypothetical protein WCK76_00630 [Elusimicrobiota bacterium]